MATTEVNPDEIAADVVADEAAKPKRDGPDPLLEVEAFLPDRPTMRLRMDRDDDGTTYEIRLMREFGIVDQHALTQDGNEFDKLWNSPRLTHKEGQRLKTVLDRMFDKVLIAPREVKDLLDDQTRANVVRTFTYAPFVMEAAQQTADESDELPTTET